MKVLQLTDNLKTGGVQKVVLNLCTLLEGSAHLAVAAAPEGALWRNLGADVGRHYLPSRKGIKSSLVFLLWLRREIVDNGYDIVHAHQRGVALAARIATIGRDVPIVEHVHSTFKSQKLLSFRGDMLIACGSEVKQVLVNTYKRNPERIRTILNSIPDVGASKDLTLPAAKSTPPQIVGIGRLTDVKDPFKFIRVITELNSGPELLVRAVWAGDGELRTEAEHLMRELGTRGLSFLGNLDDVTQTILESDLLLMTSKREGLPLAIVEAMCLGRGVIAPNVGSCHDAIQSGINGFLYPPGLSPENLATLVKNHLKLSVLQSWGLRGREIYEKSFNSDNVSKVYTDLYLDARRRRPLGVLSRLTQARH